MEIFPFSKCFNDQLRSRGSLKLYFMCLKRIYFRGNLFFPCRKPQCVALHGSIKYRKRQTVAFIITIEITTISLKVIALKHQVDCKNNLE